VSDFVFYPVTGDGETQTTAYTWNTGTINFDTGSYWAQVQSFQTLQIGTTVVSGTVPSNGDNVGLIAGAIDPGAFALYTPDPAHGDPYIASSSYPVDVLLNSGSVAIGDLLLAGFNQYATVFGPGAPEQFPTLDVEGATLNVSGDIIDTGTVTFPPINLGFFGTISSAEASGGGTVDIGHGGTVDIGGVVPSDITFNFNDGDSNVLDIAGLAKATPTAFQGTITGYVPGDTLALPNVLPTVDNITTTASFDVATGELAIVIGEPVTIDIAIPGFAAQSGPVNFVPTANGIEFVTCYVAGTRIATPHGDVPVECLQPGDTVLTAGGNSQPVVWLGRRRVDCSRHPEPRKVLPIRIRAGAFGPALPSRDLLVSPQHAIYDEGVLIPARYLVNGSSVAVEEGAGRVEYFHVELPQHDLLLAEGLPAESYLENGDRGNFDNGGVPTRLHPDFSSWVWDGRGCAELKVVGPEVDAVKAKLARRAAACAETRVRKRGRNEILSPRRYGDRYRSASAGIESGFTPIFNSPTRIQSATCREPAL
jgi:hypothetical protein